MIRYIFFSSLDIDSEAQKSYMKEEVDINVGVTYYQDVYQSEYHYQFQYMRLYRPDIPFSHYSHFTTLMDNSFFLFTEK